MSDHAVTPSDFGTGQKKLNIYVFGLILCTILTILAFWVVMTGRFSPLTMYIIIYIAAIVQFFVQLICFLRLNTQTEAGRINVMSILFTIIILLAVVVGSLWIMQNVNYNMMSM